jgi:hypothetical protein
MSLQVQYQLGEQVNLQFISFLPENESKNNTYRYRQEEPDGIILGIPPVGPLLFPEATFALSNKGPGVFSSKIKIFCSW